MFKNLSERLFPFLIALTALSVSASAAFYSVSGLSKLFAGASFAVIIMAGSLEVAKLVIASLLYQYRNTIPKMLKYYLTIACFVLVLITSMGIYGFLSAAYQETANKEGNRDAQITLIETKRDNVQGQLDVYTEEKSNIDEAVTELRKGLSNNKVQWRDKETGQIITSTSSRTRKALEKQLDQAIGRQDVINEKVDVLNEKLFNFEAEIVEAKIGDGSAGELGPLKYLASVTGVPMDKIINVLLLIIIFVFDPLAIALVIAANFAFERLKKKQKEWIEDKAFSEHVDEILHEDEENILDVNSPLPGEEDEWGSEGPLWYDEEYNEDLPEPNDNLKRASEKNKEKLIEEEELTKEEEAWKDEMDEKIHVLSSEKNKEHLEESIEQAEEIEKTFQGSEGLLKETKEESNKNGFLTKETKKEETKEDLLKEETKEDLLDNATKKNEIDQRNGFLKNKKE